MSVLRSETMMWIIIGSMALLATVGVWRLLRRETPAPLFDPERSKLQAQRIREHRDRRYHE